MSYRRIKSESVVKNSTSKNCRQNNSGSSRSRKVLRVQAKWRHNWYEPKLESTETRVIIRGPFNKPLLVSSTPYALTEFTEKPCNRKTDQGNPHEEILNGKRAATLRTGIPDPWAEYLTFGALPATCKRIHPKELYLWSDNIQLSETVWKQFGIPLEQGIPDPWITWPKGAGWYSSEEEILTSNDDITSSSSGNYNNIMPMSDKTEVFHDCACFHKTQTETVSPNSTVDGLSNKLICKERPRHYLCPSLQKQNNSHDCCCSLCNKNVTKQQTKSINVCSKGHIHATKICKVSKPKEKPIRRKTCFTEINPCQREPRNENIVCHGHIRRTENKENCNLNSNPEIGPKYRPPFAKFCSCVRCAGVSRPRFPSHSMSKNPKMSCQCCPANSIDIDRNAVSCSNNIPYRPTQDHTCLKTSRSASNIEYGINCVCSSHKFNPERDIPSSIPICPRQAQLQKCSSFPNRTSNIRTKSQNSQEISPDTSKECSSQNHTLNLNKVLEQCPVLKNLEDKCCCTAHTIQEYSNKSNNCQTQNDTYQQCSNKINTCPSKNDTYYQCSNKTNSYEAQKPTCQQCSNKMNNYQAQNATYQQCSNEMNSYQAQNGICQQFSNGVNNYQTQNNTCQQCSNKIINFPAHTNNWELEAYTCQSKNLNQCNPNETNACTGVNNHHSPYAFAYQSYFPNLPMPNCSPPNCNTATNRKSIRARFRSLRNRTVQPYCYPPVNAELSCKKLRPRFRCSHKKRKLFKMPGMRKNKYPSCQSKGKNPVCSNEPYYFCPLSNCSNRQPITPQYSNPNNDCFPTSPGDYQYSNASKCIETPLYMALPPATFNVSYGSERPTCMSKPTSSSPPCPFASQGDCQYSNMSNFNQQPDCMQLKSFCNSEKPSFMPTSAYSSIQPWILPAYEQQTSQFHPTTNCQLFPQGTDINDRSRYISCQPLFSSFQTQNLPSSTPFAQNMCTCPEFTPFKCSASNDQSPQFPLTVCPSSIRRVTPPEIPSSEQYSDNNPCQITNSIHSVSPCQLDSKRAERDCCNRCQCYNDENKTICRKLPKDSRNLHQKIDCPLKFCICSAAQYFALLDKQDNTLAPSENGNNDRNQQQFDLSSAREATNNCIKNTNNRRRSEDLSNKEKRYKSQNTYNRNNEDNEYSSNPKKTTKDASGRTRSVQNSSTQYEKNFPLSDNNTRRVSTIVEATNRRKSLQSEGDRIGQDLNDVSEEEEEVEMNSHNNNFQVHQAYNIYDRTSSLPYNNFNKPVFQEPNEAKMSFGNKSMLRKSEPNNANETNRRPSIAPSELIESSDSGEKADESDETHSETKIPVENAVSSFTFLKVMEDKLVTNPIVRPRRESKKHRRDSVLSSSSRRNSRLAGGHCSPIPSEENHLISHLQANSETLVTSSSKSNRNSTKHRKSQVRERTKELVTVQKVEIQEIMKPNKEKKLAKNKRILCKNCATIKPVEDLNENCFHNKKKSSTNNMTMHEIHKPLEHLVDSSVHVRKEKKKATRKGDCVGKKDNIVIENVKHKCKLEHFKTNELETVTVTQSRKGNKSHDNNHTGTVKKSNKLQLGNYNIHKQKSIETIKDENKDISEFNISDVENSDNIISTNHSKKDSTHIPLKSDTIQNKISVTDKQNHTVETVYIDDESLLFTTCLEGTNDLLDVVVIPKTTKTEPENKSKVDQGVCMKTTDISNSGTTKENGIDNADLITLCKKILVESAKGLPASRGSRENLTVERPFLDINTSKVETSLETQDHISREDISYSKLERSISHNHRKKLSLQSKTVSFKDLLSENSSGNSRIQSEYDLIPYDPLNVEMEYAKSQYHKKTDKYMTPHNEHNNITLEYGEITTDFNLDTLDELMTTSDTLLTDKYLDDGCHTGKIDSSDINMQLETSRREIIFDEENQPTYKESASKIDSKIRTKQHVSKNNNKIHSLPHSNVSNKRSISATSIKRHIRNGLRRANRHKMMQSKEDEVLFSISKRNDKWFKEMSADDPIIEMNFDDTDFSKTD